MQNWWIKIQVAAASICSRFCLRLNSVLRYCLYQLISPKRDNIFTDAGQFREERRFSDSRQGQFAAHKTDARWCNIYADDFSAHKSILIQRSLVGSEYCEQPPLRADPQGIVSRPNRQGQAGEGLSLEWRVEVALCRLIRCAEYIACP